MHIEAVILVLSNCVAEAVYNIVISKMTRHDPFLAKKTATIAGLASAGATILLVLTNLF